MIRVRDSGGLTAISAIKVRDGAGLSSIGNVHVRDGSGLSLVWTSEVAITATVPSSAFGYGTSSSNLAISSESVTVTVTGGKAPYSYVWSKVGSPDANWEILSPNSQSTQFRHVAVPAYDGRLASFICTVTDARGQVVASGECDVTVENLGGFS